MAGSYKHTVNDDGTFRGVDLLDHLGDADEALEELYGMVRYLADQLAQQYAGDAQREAETVDLVEEARQSYKLGLDRLPGVRRADS